MENIKVSILVPVYGVEKYIERCARSIFGQTYQNLEIIFVDDCTPDKSIEVLTRVMDDYPERKQQTKIIKHDHNRGLSAVRNTAVAAATGEFVTHVDSDDWIEINAVEKLVKEQEKTRADIVSGQAIMHNEDNWMLLERPQFDNREDMVRDMLSLTLHHTIWGRIIRRSLYTENNIRAKEGVNVGEDLQVMSMLACFVQHTSSISDVAYNYNCSNAESYTNGKVQDVVKGLKCRWDDLYSAEYVYEFFLNHDKQFLPFVRENIKKCVQNLQYIYSITGDRRGFNKTGHSLRQYDIQLTSLERHDNLFFRLLLLKHFLLKK